jgi:hypothetical protein
MLAVMRWRADRAAGWRCSPEDADDLASIVDVQPPGLGAGLRCGEGGEVAFGVPQQAAGLPVQVEVAADDLAAVVEA